MSISGNIFGKLIFAILFTAIGWFFGRRKDLESVLGREREELATLMSAINEAILAIDLEGKPLFYNSRFALLFGERHLSKKKFNLDAIFSRNPEISKSFDEVLKTGGRNEVTFNLVGSAKQQNYIFTLSTAALRKDDGSIYGAVGIFHDVTELKRAEQIRIDFVANVSHELRTPLTSIKGYADTLRSDLQTGHTEGAAKFLDIIGRNVDRLMALISDLLDLSSLESLEAEVHKTPLNVREVTQRVLNQIEALRERKNHMIEATYQTDIVFAQAGRVEQVLTNLLENAIKYVPVGGKIQVRWEKVEGGVELHILDNGPGIPLEHQPRLFERFYRIDKARSRELGGTGLGLAIVKHIMQVHGGSVNVVSEQGKGAEFICHFPG